MKVALVGVFDGVVSSFYTSATTRASIPIFRTANLDILVDETSLLVVRGWQFLQKCMANFRKKGNFADKIGKKEN